LEEVTMTTAKTRFTQSIIVACFLALASLALALQVVSASAEPGAIEATGAGALDQPVPLQQAPVLVAVKTATLLTDTNGDGASPGDTLLYAVTIKNNGVVPATGVQFSDTPDPDATTLSTNTVRVTGTFQVSPDSEWSDQTVADNGVAVQTSGSIPGLTGIAGEAIIGTHKLFCQYRGAQWTLNWMH
jgi:uncharacterized repeat protein (TIGR01451 family)